MKVLVLLILFLPGVGFAQTVVINEIAWMGVPVEGIEERQWWRYEWLELYNPTDQSIGLQGWRIELYSGGTLDFAVGLNGAIPANGYFLAGSSEKIHGVDVNYAILTGEFRNDGQRIVLKDAQGNTREEVDASLGWFGGDNEAKLTMERRFADRSANDAQNWGSSLRTGGTPKTQNSLFEKEKFVVSAQNQVSIKKESAWSSLVQGITNTLFIRAFLIALLFAAAILALRRYLVSGLPSGGSCDARKD